MGVAGSGKTTVGEQLAARLGVDFGDADEFHSPQNIAKMAAGTPLTDEDRRPWLDAIAEWLGEHERSGGVATCSALRRSYRDILRGRAADTWFLYLAGSPALMTSRVGGRSDHVMPTELVTSQFETLEPPDDGERHVDVAASLRPEQIVDVFVASVDGAEPGTVG
jgi:gluconokinase